MRAGLLIFLYLFSGCLWALPRTGQLLVVLSDSWDSPRGRIYLLERSGHRWRRFSGNWPVSLGRKGLGWGRGVKDWQETGPVKKEGDGKAPAGLFAIRKRLYGYSKTAPVGTTLPYEQLTPSWVGVDDPKSKYYNRVFDKNTIMNQDWDSCEKMRRDDCLYKWLLIVEHNTDSPVPGAGSCIFIHIWRGLGHSTAGCTAMSEQNLLRLIGWLDLKRKPLLLQLPRSVYLKYQSALGLPPL